MHVLFKMSASQTKIKNNFSDCVCHPIYLKIHLKILYSIIKFECPLLKHCSFYFKSLLLVKKKFMYSYTLVVKKKVHHG